MTQEEKAQRYDKAVESLRAVFYDDNNRMCEEYRDACKRIIEPIFPELKESDDERIRKELIEYHKAQAFLDGKPNNKHVKYVDWLKSLRPQNTWKPSDEQMTALEAMLTVSPQSPAITSALIELYQDLKKLKS